MIDQSLKKYAVFTGRATRAEYWVFFLFFLLWIFFGVLVDTALNTFDEDVGVGIVTALIIFAFFVPAISVGARRLHDIGRSG